MIPGVVGSAVGPANAPTVSGDPSFSSVVVLLHFDGADGSTTLTDSSSKNKTFTAAGNAQLDTAQFKFGTASGLFDGTGDQWTTTSTMADFAFGSADYAIEAWIRTTASGASYKVCSNFQLFQNTFTLGMRSDGLVEYAIAGSVVKTSASAVNDGSWHHIAVTRSGTTLRMFVDGVLQGSTVTNSITMVSGTTFRVGSGNSDEYWNGWIDDLRVTNGVARYTATFSPPTEAFPNS